MSDYLFLICELAVAFAGFTAVVTVLHISPDERERALLVNRVRQMLELSLVTVAAGLAPGLLMRLGLEGEGVWRIAGAVFVVVGLVLIRIQGPRGFAARVRAAPGYNVPISIFLVVLGVVVILGFGLAASGITDPEGAYTLAITLLLGMAGIQFLRASVWVLQSSERSEATEGAARENRERGP